MNIYDKQRFQHNATQTSAQDEIDLHVPLAQPGAQVFVNPATNATTTPGIPTWIEGSVPPPSSSTDERISHLEAQLLQLQVQCAENVRTFIEELSIHRESLQILTQRIDRLEQAPKEREEKFQKLWNWVKRLDERIMRLEPGKDIKLTPSRWGKKAAEESRDTE